MLSTHRGLLLALLSAPTAIRAIPWEGPARTQSVENLLGWTPKPTDAAVLAHNELFELPIGDELFQRQLGYRTCGFYYGSKRYPYTCDKGDACVSNTIQNNWGCCTADKYIDGCRLFTSCIPYAAISALCPGGSCATDGFLNVCTDPNYDKCKTYYIDFDGTRTVSRLQCDSTTGHYTLSNTYKGLDSSGFQLSYDDYRTAATDITYLSLATFFPSKTSHSKTTSPSKNPQTTASGGSEPSRQTGDSKDDHHKQSSDSGSGTNVGAIAGGTVGGLAVLAIIGGILVWLYLRSRQKKRQPIVKGSQGYSAMGQPPSGYSHSPAQSPMAQHPYNGYYSDQPDSSTRPTSVGGTAVPSSVSTSNPTANPTPTIGRANLVPPPIEADSQPVMTTPDGRQVHELSGH